MLFWIVTFFIVILVLINVLMLYRFNKLMQKSLYEQNRYMSILNSAGEGIYGVDAEGKFTFVNLATEKILGYKKEEMIGKRVHDLIHHSKHDKTKVPESECPLFKSQQSGASLHLDQDVFWKKDNNFIYVDLTSTPLVLDGKSEGSIVIFSDITKKKALEDEVWHTSRLASIGTMAQGISHEINNPLCISMMFFQRIGEIIKNQYHADEKLNTFFDKAEEALHRIRDITRSVQDFSNLNSDKIEMIDVHEVVQKTFQLMNSSLETDGILIEQQLSATNFKIEANSSKLQQALVYLIKNSHDAIKIKNATDLRKIVIRTFNWKDNIVLSVEDNGCGIKKEDLPRVFDLFFTTKGPKEGKGLGLSITHSMIKSFGGDIRIDSIPGRATGVTITLPLRKA